MDPGFGSDTSACRPVPSITPISSPAHEQDGTVTGHGRTFDWRGELWRSLTRPGLRWVWSAMALAAAVPTAACLWILVVNLPAAVDGQIPGARTLEWAMVLVTLLGGATTIGSWRMAQHARENALTAAEALGS